MYEPAYDPARLTEIKRREDASFAAARPRSLALWNRGKRSMPNGVPMSWLRTSYDHPPLFISEGEGARFRDVDGNEYSDFNIADMSMFGGYAPPPVVKAVSRRVAQGSQFLLPNEDGVWVAEELSRRYALPKWQFTLSATHANTEAIRVARELTGRDTVVMFDGKYHGHFDEALVRLDAQGRIVPEEGGLPRDVSTRTRLVRFNDPGALRAALEPRDVAIVLTEPALTNNVGLLLPEPGFHEALRAATRETSTVLAYDETHTQVVGPGGLTRLWKLDPDIVTTGKSIASGVPLGAYGMTEAVAGALEEPAGTRNGKRVVATGGTLFGNPLSMAAARATMAEVLTGETYEHTQALGGRLADGIEGAIRSAGLPWTAHRFWPRSGVTFAATMPRDAREGYENLDVPLRRALRVHLANRGVWDAIVGAGPTVPVPADQTDVDRYVEAFSSFVRELAS
ncbi:MAG: aminotransferase class III-fold pyridoxal phosphate-dependent enzyme [Actinobacteria bacterium]|nr:aminotransferase class III-fold pyridoxal phosphate-dependent enzyme [Actinomycetota bacterium]